MSSLAAILSAVVDLMMGKDYFRLCAEFCRPRVLVVVVVVVVVVVSIDSTISRGRCEHDVMLAYSYSEPP
jgi:hypothetical protein